MHSTHYQPGETIDNQFLIHEIRTGGMSEIYLCIDLSVNKPLALKTLKSKYQTSENIHLLFEEVRTWINLQKHPNVVYCWLMDSRANLPFLFLEWITGDTAYGVSLREWLSHGPLLLENALQFLIDACNGLMHAQQRVPGLVHRDLKPENILVSNTRVAKITDFGLARTLTKIESETSSGANVAGTPPYMAPEQWLGTQLDHRTDIYALGCILFELLTGKMLFSGKSIREVRELHLGTSVPELPNKFDLSLNMILQKCLTRSALDRYPTILQLRDDLVTYYKKACSDEPRLATTSNTLTEIELVDLGYTYDELGMTEDALASYNQAIDINPNFADAYSNRGGIYLKRKEFKRALEDFDQAISLNPEQVYYYVNRSRAYLKLKQIDRALTELQQALTMRPKLAPLYVERGNIFQQQEKYEKALDDYNQAIQLNPTYASAFQARAELYLAQNAIEKALADISVALRTDPLNPYLHGSYGDILSADGKIDQAIDSYTKAIMLKPDFSLAFRQRALAHSRLNQFDDALSDLTKSINLDPEDAHSYFERGNLNHKSGNYDQALHDYQTSIDLMTDYAEAYQNRGNVYLHLKKPGEAINDFKQAIELKPELKEPYINLGIIYNSQNQHQRALHYLAKIKQDSSELSDEKACIFFQQLGVSHFESGHFDEAVEHFEQAIRLCSINEESIWLFAQLGIAKFNIGELQQAFDYFTFAIENGYTNAVTLMNRGIIYQQAQNYQHALQDLQAALAINPELADLHYNLGVIYYETGFLQKAIDSYSNAIMKDPGHAKAHHNLGYIYTELQQYQKAISYYTRSIELDPLDPYGYSNFAACLLSIQRVDEALSLINQGIDLIPDSAALFSDRGVIYLQMNNRYQALSDLEHAIKLDPQFDRAWLNKGSILAQAGNLHDALICFDAAAQLGNSQAIQIAKHIRQQPGMPPGTVSNSEEKFYMQLMAIFRQHGEMGLRQILSQQGASDAEIDEIIELIKDMNSGDA